MGWRKSPDTGRGSRRRRAAALVLALSPAALSCGQAPAGPGAEPARAPAAAAPAETATDADGDGVAGARDGCPAEPEDCDGFQDGDGCPDRDDDRDGILDGCDVCPREPETFQGMADADGCPDVPVDDFGDPRHEYAAPLMYVQFEWRSARLDAALQRELAALSARLREQGEIQRIACVGRATADEAKPDVLSRQRAEAVMKHLIDEGLDPARMEARGVGARPPRSAAEPGGATSPDGEPTRAVLLLVLRARDMELWRWSGARFDWVAPPHEHAERRDAPLPDPRCSEKGYTPPAPAARPCGAAR